MLNAFVRREAQWPCLRSPALVDFTEFTQKIKPVMEEHPADHKEDQSRVKQRNEIDDAVTAHLGRHVYGAFGKLLAHVWMTLTAGSRQIFLIHGGLRIIRWQYIMSAVTAGAIGNGGHAKFTRKAVITFQIGLYTIGRQTILAR